MAKHNYLTRRLKSFQYAFNGLNVLFKEEPNSVIHLIAALLVILLGLILSVTTVEWLALIFAIGIVFVMELVNTAIENICNFISPAQHVQIKRIKDLAAAGVLLSAITAAIVGLVVFVPHLWECVVD